MIKTIKKFQIKLTPFNVTKDWSMSTTNNQDVLLMETDFEEDPVALEFIDYGNINTSTPVINSECDIALEQQPDDLVNTRLGLNVKGIFYPNLDPINIDDTYKRMVYTQIKTSFYNDYRDPTKIWGIDTLDFDLSKTKRKISDEIKLFDIPRMVYGERIISNTIEIKDNSVDDNTLITDDGNGNLVAGTNLFSRKQEIGNHKNIFMSGISHYCDNYFNPPLPSYIENSNIAVGLISGSIINIITFDYLSESSSFNIGLINGSTFSVPYFDYLISSIPAGCGINTGIISGSLVTTIISVSGSDSSSIDSGFYTGSLLTVILTVSGSNDSSSVDSGFYSGSITTIAINLPETDYTSFTLGILSGSLL